jgi:hypothetical protein
MAVITEDRLKQLMVEAGGSIDENSWAIARKFASLVLQDNASINSSLKNLTEDEILELWDWDSGEILATDILDFANAHWRVLSGLI